MPDDTILASIKTIGCGPATAAAERTTADVNGSRHIAQVDFARVDALKTKFESAAAATGMPRALLAALASRETHCGLGLDGNGDGDRGNAFGIMQVDKRSHTIQGRPDPKSQTHINQAAKIFADGVQQMVKKFPGASEAEQFKAAVSAYNCGPSGVHSVASSDDHTTHHDYANDTWVRAQFFAARWAT